MNKHSLFILSVFFLGIFYAENAFAGKNYWENLYAAFVDNGKSGILYITMISIFTALMGGHILHTSQTMIEALSGFSAGIPDLAFGAMRGALNKVKDLVKNIFELINTTKDAKTKQLDRASKAPSKLGKMAEKGSKGLGNAVDRGASTLGNAVSRTGSAAGSGLMKAGAWISATGIGAIVGVPMILAGATISAGSKVGGLAIKAGGKAAKYGIKATGKATRMAMNASKKVANRMKQAAAKFRSKDEEDTSQKAKKKYRRP